MFEHFEFQYKRYELFSAMVLKVSAYKSVFVKPFLFWQKSKAVTNKLVLSAMIACVSISSFRIFFSSAAI